MGVDAITIIVEVNVSMGQGYQIVGLPDIAIKESLQRTESAIKSNGFSMPRIKVVINLAPADIKKTGAAFDLPIAIGILAASDQLIQEAQIHKYMLMGELGLDGTIHPIRGALAMAIRAKKENQSLRFAQFRWVPVVLVAAQVCLGIVTVLLSTRLARNSFGPFEWVAQGHQVVAMLLSMSLLWSLFLLRKR